MDYKQILKFWFEELELKDWFSKNDELDEKIRATYSQTIQDAKDKKLDHWKENPMSSLALIILLDQFTRNIFRDMCESYEGDSYAQEIVLNGLEKGFDKELKGPMKTFFYMPLMHSEKLEHQDLCLKLFTEAAKEDESYKMNIDYAKKHRDIIVKFGRFPYMNKPLGRENTTEEDEYLKDGNPF